MMMVGRIRQVWQVGQVGLLARSHRVSNGLSALLLQEHA